MNSSMIDLEKGRPNLKETGNRNPADNDRKLGEIPHWTWKEFVVAVTAAITAYLSFVSIFVVSNTIVYLSSLFGIMIPPYSALLQQKITESEALKETNEAMDREVNNLKYENGRLEGQVKKLETSVSNLCELEETLSNIRHLESANLDELEKQLVESQEILEKLEISLVGIVIQNMISVVLACDMNGDNQLQDDEIENMIKSVEGIDGVDINDALIKTKIIERGRDIHAVMALIRDVLQDSEDRNKPPDQRLFHFIHDIDSDDSDTTRSRHTTTSGSTIGPSRNKCREMTSPRVDWDPTVRLDTSFTGSPSTSCSNKGFMRSVHLKRRDSESLECHHASQVDTCRSGSPSTIGSDDDVVRPVYLEQGDSESFECQLAVRLDASFSGSPSTSYSDRYVMRPVRLERSGSESLEVVHLGEIRK